MSAFEDEAKLNEQLVLEDQTTQEYYLSANLFTGAVIPDSTAVFFDAEPDNDRPEIKGADITIRGSDQPTQIIYGKCRVGGVITFITTDVPGGGEWLHLVNTIAGHKCEKLEAMYVNGELVPFGTVDGNIYGWSTGSWALGSTGYVNVSFSDGDADQPANPDLLAQSAALFPGIWTPNHRQRGLAHVYNILYFSPEKFTTLPDIQYLVEGKTDIYDPRTDSYVYTNNAALVIADYLSNTEYGLGAAYGTDIDLDSLEEAADLCDETVSGEPRYTINGVFDTNEEPKKILENMQTAIGGSIVHQGGKWKIYPAAWREPTITLSTADVIGNLKITTQKPRRELFNAVKGTYLNSTSWEVEDFPAITNTFYESQDGERIYLDVTYPFTTSHVTAQRLSKIRLERARQPIEMTGVFTLKAWQAQAGENIYFNFPELGWSDKAFEIRRIQLVMKEGVLAVDAELQETAEGVFDWSNGEETTFDLAPNTNLPSPQTVTAPTGLRLESGTKHLYTRRDGTVFSRIYATWTPNIDPFVRNGGQIHVYLKNVTAGEEYRMVAVLSGDESETYLLDVKDGDVYSVRIRNKNTIGKESDYIEAQEQVVGKTAPPTVVTNLTGTPNELGIDLTWPPVVDADLSHYVLGYTDNRENKLLYSQDFENAVWEKNLIEIESTTELSPTGKNDATLIRVNPLKQFSPLDFPNLEAWYDGIDASTMYDATSGGSQTAIGAAIARWENKASASHHATQATSGARPKRATRPITGRRNLWNHSEPTTSTGFFTDNVTFQAGTFADLDGEIVYGDDSVARRARVSPSSYPGYVSEVIPDGTQVTLSFYIKMDDLSVPNSGGETWGDFVVERNNQYFKPTTFVHVGDDVYFCQHTFNQVINYTIGITKSTSGFSSKPFKVSRFQLEKAASATDYQKTMSAYEAYEAGIENEDYPAFDGTDDYMVADSLAASLSGTDKPFTIYVVKRQAALIDNVTSFCFARSNTLTPLVYDYVATGTNQNITYTRGDGGSPTDALGWFPTPLNNNRSIYASTYSAGAGLKVHRDGVAGTSESTLMGAATLDWFTIGAFRRFGTSTGSGFWNGDIVGLLVFTEAHTAADRKRIEGYLSEYYGVASLEYPEGIAGVPTVQCYLNINRPETLFDSNSGGSLVAADGPIRRVEDLSGNAFHATQSVTANAPLRKVGVLNGADTARFDGSNDHLTLGTQLGRLREYTIFFVTKALTHAASNFGVLISSDLSGSSTTANFLVYQTAETAMRSLFSDDTNVSSRLITTIVKDEYFLLSTRHADGDTFAEIFQDGIEPAFSDVASATGDAYGSGTPRNTFIGRWNSGANQWYWNGDIAAIVIASSALSDEDLNYIHLQLGIEFQLPLPYSQSYSWFQGGVEVEEGEFYRVGTIIKRGGVNNVRISLGDGFAADTYVDIDLLNGALLGASGAADQVSIVPWQNDYYYVSFEAEGTDDTDTKVHFNMLSDDGKYLFDQTAESSITVFGVFFQSRLANGKYKMTLATPATAGVRTIIADRIDTNRYLWGIQAAGTYDVNVVAVDTSGNESLEYTTATVTIAAPSEPQNFTGQIVGQNIVLTWSTPAQKQFTVEQYEVKDGSTVLDLVKGNLYQFKANWSGSKTFTVLGIDIAGNEGTEASVDVVITAPGQVTNLRTVVIDNNVLLYFDEPTVHTLPIDFYLIKKGADFGTAVIVGDTSRGFINLFETLGGSYRYWVVPVDTAGNLGQEESIDAFINQPPDFILYDTAEVDPVGYNVNTNILLMGDGSFIAPIVIGETFEDQFTNNGYDTIQEFIDDGYTIWIEPGNDGAAAVVSKTIDLGLVIPSSMVTSSILEVPVVGSGMTVVPEISYSLDGSTYTSGGSGNNPILATNFQYIKTRYTITAPDDKTISQFYEHTYRVQVKKQTDSGTVEVTANPTTVNFNLDFLDVTSIVLTVKGTTHKVAIYDFVDAPNPTDFDIYVTDSSGADASGSGVFVSWLAEGIVNQSE